MGLWNGSKGHQCSVETTELKTGAPPKPAQGFREDETLLLYTAQHRTRAALNYIYVFIIIAPLTFI